MNPTRTWLIHGAIGALVTPVMMALIALAHPLLQHDSLMHQAVGMVLAVILAPPVWCIEKVLAANGIHGDEGMAYLVPIFVALLAYSILLGFIGGVMIGKLRKTRSGRSSPVGQASRA